MWCFGQTASKPQKTKDSLLCRWSKNEFYPRLKDLKVKKYRLFLRLNRFIFILAQTKIMHTNTKMAQSMGKTTKTMQAINKTMDPQKVAKTMQVT